MGSEGIYKHLPDIISSYVTSRAFVIMVALCNRADHYIFILWFLYGRPA